MSGKAAMYLSLSLSFLLLAFLPPIYAEQRSIARVLIYTRTTGFRHDSIPTAVEAVTSRGSDVNVRFEHTEDQGWFTATGLKGYDALVFLSASGEALDRVGQDALQAYLNDGGNFVGIHSASDCLLKTDFYERTVGAYFDYHPPLADAMINVLDGSHPSTRMLPTRWRIHDEMYNFKSDPRAVGAVVILSADESSYQDTGPRRQSQGTPHPTAWYQEHGAGATNAGRSFYTSLGHLNETWEDELFMSHVMGGITWALNANTTKAFNGDGLVGNEGEALPAMESSSGSASESSAPEATSNTSTPAATTPEGQTSSSTHRCTWDGAPWGKIVVVLLLLTSSLSHYL